MYLCLLPPKLYPENALVRSLQQILHNQNSLNSRLHFPICCLEAQMVKNLPATRETWDRSLVWEDALKEGMATYSSILAWRIPKDGGAWRATYSPWACKELDKTELLSTKQPDCEEIYFGVR